MKEMIWMTTIIKEEGEIQIRKGIMIKEETIIKKS